MDQKVTEYIAKAKKWKNEMVLLRDILLNSLLEESIKWGKPCYTFNNSNLIIIQAFKDHCDLGFFKGGLLKDPKNKLVKAGEHTQLGRQLRFLNELEITKSKTLIKSYIKEAIELEKKGESILPIKVTENIPVPELDKIFKTNIELKKAFQALTPGRQRAYLIFFSAAKQTETRIIRIQKCTPKILCGKGMNDCTCGLSKRMPNCDGSHNKLKK
jgi:uncharacterized protein YdeI (YjbR/CyaY-like superfamily)